MWGRIEIKETREAHGCTSGLPCKAELRAPTHSQSEAGAPGTSLGAGLSRMQPSSELSWRREAPLCLPGACPGPAQMPRGIRPLPLEEIGFGAGAFPAYCPSCCLVPCGPRGGPQKLPLPPTPGCRDYPIRVWRRWPRWDHMACGVECWRERGSPWDHQGHIWGQGASPVPSPTPPGTPDTGWGAALARLRVRAAGLLVASRPSPAPGAGRGEAVTFLPDP